MLRGLTVLSLSMLSVADPAMAQDRPIMQNGAAITYELPTTVVSVTAELTLTSCTGGPQGTAAITIAPVAGRASSPRHRFTINGPELESFFRSRQIAITTHPNGALKTINATLADRTFSIVSTVLKAALSFAALEGRSAGALECTQEIKDTLAYSAELRSNIARLRRLLLSAPHESAEGITNQINALAAERARLQTGALRLTLTTDVSPISVASDGTPITSDGGVITWRRSDFAPWIGPVTPGADGPVDAFSLKYCLISSAIATATCTSRVVTDAEAVRMRRTNLREPEQVQNPLCAADNCRRTLVLREPVSARMSVISSSPNIRSSAHGEWVGDDAVLKTAELQIAQWGTLSYIPLRVGFGGSRTLALTMDEFGRRSSFEWKADARGEGVATGVASVAEQGLALRNAINGRAAAERQAQIADMQAQRTLNELRYCQAVIESGGFVCPAAPTAPTQ